MMEYIGTIDQGTTSSEFRMFSDRREIGSAAQKEFERHRWALAALVSSRITAF